MRFFRAGFATALVLSGSSVALAQTNATWSGPITGGDWNTAANWTPANVPDSVGEAATLASLGPQAATVNRIITLSAPISLSGLNLQDDDSDTVYTARQNTINSDTGQLVTFDNGASNVVINITGTTTTTSANSTSFRGPTVLNSNLVINADMLKANSGAPDYNVTLGLLNFLGSGSTMTGPGGVTKNGVGALFMADVPKEFQGPLVVNNGRLRFNPNARTPTLTSSVTVNSGGQLSPEASGDLTFGRDRTILSLPVGTLTLNGHGIAPFPGALRSGLSGIDQTFNNAVTLGSTASIDVISGSPSAIGRMRLTNTVSGPGKLIVNELPGDPTRGGELILSAANNYSGGTEIDQGWLVLSGAIATAGAGDVKADGRSVQPGALPGSNFFAGVLRIEAGVTNGIGDKATLSLTGDGGGDSIIGGLAELGSGINETVGRLILNGLPQAPGTYGSTSAPGATHQDNAFFSSVFGDGIITNIGYLPADFNEDGLVNGTDLAQWKTSFAANNANADADFDGDSDGADFLLWQQQVGATPAFAAASAAPEPGSLLLVLAAAPLAAMARRRR